MAKRPINILKEYFETGDRPTEAQFYDLIDSFLHKDEGVIISNYSYVPETGVLTLSFSDNSETIIELPTELSTAQINQFLTDLDAKVDKVPGKGLSTNDYSDAEAQKVTSAQDHINNGDIHTTAEEKTRFNNRIKSYTPAEVIPLGAGETFRIFSGNVYKLLADKPFTTNDIVAETNEATPKWEIALEAPAGSLSQLNDDIGATELEIVKVVDKSQIVNKVLDETKKYSIRQNLILGEGETINMNNSPLIEGLGADFTNIETTATNGVIFSSQSAKNINLKNISLTASGTGSKVFDLKDANADLVAATNGVYEFRVVGVNFINCKDVGLVNGFRQFFATDLGFYGCDNGIELKGVWSGLYLQNSNLFGFASTGTLFRQGANLSFSDRCIIQMNVNVPAGAVIMDWQPSVFLDDEALQLVNWVAKIDGVKSDANGLILLPNLSANNPKCLWSGNTGLPNTALEKIVIDSAVSGVYEIDWLNDTYDITLTGDTTFTEINLPASGRRTKTLNLTIDGNFTPTFPAAWTHSLIGTFKPGEINDVSIKFIYTGKYFTRINNSLTIYPAPNLKSTEPAGLYPEQTVEYVLNGSFFTPATIVSIESHTVNSIEFVDSSKLILGVTTSASEGDFDLIISNGTEIIFSNVVTIANGTITIPLQADYINISGFIDLQNPGEALVTNYNNYGYGHWTKVFPMNKNWSFRWNYRKSPLGAIDGNGGIHPISLHEVTSGTEVAYGAIQSDSRWIAVGASSYQYNLFDLDTKPEEIRNIDGRLYAYRGGVQVATGNLLVDDVKMRVLTRYVDLVRIKYTEYATV